MTEIEQIEQPEQINLSAAVHDLIREELAANRQVRRDYVVIQIMSKYSDCHGRHAELHMGSTRWRIEQQMNAHVGKYGGKRTPAPTITQAAAEDWNVAVQGQAQIGFSAPGFDCLQTAYSFEIDGEIVLIPIDQCEIPKLRQRANEYRIMSAGNLKHADELDEYCDERERQGELALVQALEEVRN